MNLFKEYRPTEWLMVWAASELAARNILDGHYPSASNNLTAAYRGVLEMEQQL